MLLLLLGLLASRSYVGELVHYKVIVLYPIGTTIEGIVLQAHAEPSE